jgi:FliI/YscN family ATPase
MTLLDSQLDAVKSAMPLRVVGQVQAISGLTIEASDLPLPIGSMCRIDSLGGRSSSAEVVGFQHDRTLLMTLSDVSGISRGDRIENVASSPRVWCGPALLGRVLDGFGRPIDGKGDIPRCESRRIDGKSVRPMQRVNVDQPICTSVRCIDGLHTCGRGQRMGIFSGPGVGKSTLLGCIAKHTSADISVVALIGERGKEVQQFLQDVLDETSRQRCVVIVATADDAPLLRVRAAKVACAIAEHFRDEGKDVLLLMDSLTRLCQAQRQIGLAAREPPATKGFPPSVFALLPEILERAGRTAVGSVTGFYTVLVEGDDFNEPIPDAVKGITDGHLWLNRALSNRGHFPAIDPVQSISRARSDVLDDEHLASARRVLALYAIYQDIEDLVNIGAYVPGANPEYDLAVQSRPRIVQYLQQTPQAPSNLEEARKQLFELVAWIDQTEKQIKSSEGRQPARQTATVAIAR